MKTIDSYITEKLKINKEIVSKTNRHHDKLDFFDDKVCKFTFETEDNHEKFVIEAPWRLDNLSKPDETTNKRKIEYSNTQWETSDYCILNKNEYLQSTTKYRISLFINLDDARNILQLMIDENIFDSANGMKSFVDTLCNEYFDGAEDKFHLANIKIKIKVPFDSYDATCEGHIKAFMSRYFDDAVTEKLKINNNVISKVAEYKYHPKSVKELHDLIEKLLEERGKDADLNDIDTSGIISMSELFIGLDPHDIDISRWDVSNVQFMYKTFDSCRNLNCDLSRWDVSKVIDTNYMFYDCRKFNSNLSNWDVSKVQDSRYMFYNCWKFDSDLSDWDVSGMLKMTGIFYNCKSLKSTDFENWNTSNAKYKYNIFKGCDSLKDIPSWYKE